jgi:hypothetical protein
MPVDLVQSLPGGRREEMDLVRTNSDRDYRTPGWDRPWVDTPNDVSDLGYIVVTGKGGEHVRAGAQFLNDLDGD